MNQRGSSVRPFDGRSVESRRRGLGDAAPAIIATMTGLLLCLLGPIIATSAATQEPMGGAVWDCMAGMVLAGGRLAYLIGLGSPRLLELTFWIFGYVFLGIAPIIQIRSGVTPSTTPGVYASYNELAAIAVLIGMVCFLVGALIPTGSAGGGGTFKVSEKRARRLALFAILASAYYTSRVGLSSLFLNRTDFGLVKATLWPDPSIGSLVVDVCTLPLLVSFVALLQVNSQRRRAGLPSRRLLPFATAALVLLTVNPISSPRYYSATVLLGVVAALGAYATPKRVRASTVSLLLGLIYLFPLADAFRSADSPEIDFQPAAAFLSGDFDAFAQINNTLLYLDERGSTWGRQAVGLLTFWLPRSAWPDKPIDTGILLANFRHYRFTNLSAPLWSELLINGGWPLLIVGMVALGLLVRRVDTRSAALMASGQRLPVLGYILPFYAMILLRGSLLQAMLALAVITLPAWWVSRGAPPEQSPSGGEGGLSPTRRAAGSYRGSFR